MVTKPLTKWNVWLSVLRRDSSKTILNMHFFLIKNYLLYSLTYGKLESWNRQRSLWINFRLYLSSSKKQIIKILEIIIHHLSKQIHEKTSHESSLKNKTIDSHELTWFQSMLFHFLNYYVYCIYKRLLFINQKLRFLSFLKKNSIFS